MPPITYDDDDLCLENIGTLGTFYPRNHENKFLIVSILEKKIKKVQSKMWILDMWILDM